MKLIFTATIIFVGLISSAFSQNSIPSILQEFNNKVDKSQLALQAIDGTADGQFTPYYNNDKLNKISNDAATDGIDNLQDYINKNNEWDNNKKIKYLRGLSNLIDRYKTFFIGRNITGAQLVTTLKAYKEAMDLDSKGDGILPVIEENKYEISFLLTVNDAFQNNPDKDNYSGVLIRKNLHDNPAQTLVILNTLLKQKNEYPGTDSLISKIAHDSCDEIYNWSQSYGINYPLGERIRKSSNPLVQTISRIANSQGLDGAKNGRQYMPFLDALYKGDISFDKIDADLADESHVKYFKELVRTRINYVGNEIQNRDTAMALDLIKTRIHDVAVDADGFVNVVNGLHEKPNDVRYACLEPLSPIDLYYLVVSCEVEMYTSTYVNGKDYGIYNLIWQKGGKELSGDSLLMAVNFDMFKKWIKMAANYNTLDNFLNRMNPDNSKKLMMAFVRGLDKNTTKDSLEDAVDVAGTYASIDNKDMKDLVLNEVQNNLNIAKRTHNRKAYNIYDILNTLFLSMDSTNHIDVSEKLGIEPVYFMPIDKLKDSTGRIIIQQFTYGDLDGKTNYENFIDKFSRAGWKTNISKFWATVSSTSGTPITIYTNRPYDEHSDPSDDDAQKALDDYLATNDLYPTLVFHRGHSYYLRTTLQQLQSSARVVFLGSCGGFQNLHDVLSKSPNAQIISTKQTGAGDLNLPMIQGIIETLRKGRDLDWVSMWKGFSKDLKSDARFNDYVPPYENLGAVFLMAYQKMQEREKEQEEAKEVSTNKQAE